MYGPERSTLAEIICVDYEPELLGIVRAVEHGRDDGPAIRPYGGHLLPG
jgi:hypothetical protein